MDGSMIAAIALFAVAYILLVSEKVNKTVIVLFGACIYLLFKFIPFEKAVHHIDMNVILLLIGMMMVVKISEKSGMYEWVAIWSAKKVGAKPGRILVMLFVITGVFSAFLDNVTTVLLISPISLLLATQLEITPFPFLVAEIIASNVGGTATLIGDPPNIMIGSAVGLSFMDFLTNLGPLIVIEMVVVVLLLLLVFRKKLRTTPEAIARLMKMEERTLIKNKKLLIHSLLTLGFIIGGFLLHGALEVEACVFALLGASILALLAKTDMDEMLAKVEWGTIMFFIGLFIMVGALEASGVIGKMAGWILDKTRGNIHDTAAGIMFFTGITSSILDNIPLVAAFIPAVKIIGMQIGMSQMTPVWWGLSLGACLGGNGTLVGASANVVMMNFAKRNRVALDFVRYLAYGVPFTLLTLGIAYFYLTWRYF